MIPDKIFLEKERETNKISHLWGASPVLHSGYEHIEYIRKDALLEWARNSRDSAGKLSYTEFIDKIESL